MPIRYYLIPFETNPSKMIADIQPKHLELCGECKGLISKVVGMNESTITKFLRNYYIVQVPYKDLAELAELEKQKDVLRLDKDTKIDDLSAIRVETKNITDLSTRDEKDFAVTKWLIGEEKIISDVLKIPIDVK